MAFLMFYVTYPDEQCAREVVRHLLDEKLVACANLFPVESAYVWEGSVHDETEWVSILKTQLSNETKLETAIGALHPYAVPCILRYEVRANAAYENWIVEQSGGVLY